MAVAILFGLGIGIIPKAGTGLPATDIPVIQFAPSISAIETVGQTVGGDDGGWSQFPTGYAYKHQRANDGAGAGAADIAGATASTYALQSADTGKYVRRGVLASNLFGPAVAYAYSAWIGPIAAELSISGTPPTTGFVGTPLTPFAAPVTGGHGPYVYSLAEGTLLDGMSVDPDLGLIGAPTEAGVASDLVIRATDTDGLTAYLPAFDVTVTAASPFSFPLFFLG